MAATSLANPFPVDAVAKFGGRLLTCPDIKYMQEAREYLAGYLQTYPDDGSRPGAAIGIKGRYGAGKTHLLNWLASEAANRRSATVSTAYAKFDSASIFDLYRQILQKIDRQRLVEITMLARLEIAREQVLRAKATESLRERLDSVDAVQTLAMEKNLDAEEVTLELRSRLEKSEVPNELAHLLLQLSDSSLGPEVYRWLSGDVVENPQRFGISHQLAAMPSGPSGVVDGDTAAINALEMIARLHQLARVPFILFVDQLETVTRSASADRIESLSSLLKKFIEQVTRQRAFIVIAGTNEGWVPLTRDVGPRLMNRVPLTVGSLTLPETRIFLEAYTERDGMGRFPNPVVVEIHQLSGGNPREVIRIAYCAFDLSDGNISGLTIEQVLQSANTSQTVAEREQDALRMCELVLATFGTVGGETRTTTGETIHLTLSRNDRVVAAVRIAKATDPLHEIDIARHIEQIRRYAKTNWPNSQLLVVTVGYSSTEVLDLLGTSTLTIEFDEKTFEASLRSRVQEVIARIPVKSQPTLDAELLERLDELQARLAEVEVRRQQEADAVQRRFERKANELGAPVRAEQTMRSRWDLQRLMDELSEAARLGEVLQERDLMQSILAANETYVRNDLLEVAGSSYLEAIAAQRSSPDARAPFQQIRLELILEMQRAVRVSTRLTRFYAILPLVATIGLAVAVISWLVSGLIYGQWIPILAPRYMSDPTLGYRALTSLLAIALLAGAGSFYAYIMRRATVRRRVRSVERRMRTHGTSSLVNELVTRYPQARG